MQRQRQIAELVGKGVRVYGAEIRALLAQQGDTLRPWEHAEAVALHPQIPRPVRRAAGDQHTGGPTGVMGAH